MIANAFYANKEDLCTPKGIISLINSFCSADIFQSFCRMNRDSLRDKIHEFDCQVCQFDCQFGFLLRTFRKHEASCVYVAVIQEIPQQAP